MPQNDRSLDAALLDAHGRKDREALIELYTRAADAREAEGQTEAADFYLTHAYVFALEGGHVAALSLHTRLKEHGKEE